MKAIVYQRHGSPEVLTLREVEKPAPAANEALLRIRAASVTPLDRHFLTGKPWMARLMAGPLRPTRKALMWRG